jgi:tetratricopeptide (TPR) repeat protein
LPANEAALHAGLDLLAQLSLSAGDAERALACAQRAVREAGDDSVLRARALTSLAHVTWERDQRAREVIPILDEALDLATAAGAAEIEADALRVKASVAQKHGAEDADYRGADALFERAEALYVKTGQQRRAYRVALSRAGGLAGLGRYEEARTMLARCERYFTGLDSAADLIAVANIAGYLESLQERWPEAVAAARRGVELAWERHGAPFARSSARQHPASARHAWASRGCSAAHGVRRPLLGAKHRSAFAGRRGEA